MLDADRFEIRLMVEPTARVVVARAVSGRDVERHVQAAGDLVQDLVLELRVGRRRLLRLQLRHLPAAGHRDERPLLQFDRLERFGRVRLAAGLDAPRLRRAFAHPDARLLLRLRLQLGSETSDMSLSFEEPWLFQQRLGLGFNLFRTTAAYNQTLYKEVHTGNMAINSQPRDGRGRCMQLGFCFQGCESGAKWSTLYTEIPKAEATGNLDLRPEAHVTRIEHNDRGMVSGVVYFDKDGKEQRQSARVVCVAGNSIETPRLLLLSASNMFRDGLANSSGQVGRNYMRHMTGSVYAAFKDHVNMFRGTTMAGIVRDEAGLNTKRGFVGGYELETLSLGLPFMAAFLNPGAWGSDFTWWMERYANLAGMWLVGEDMPRETNRITLNTDVKDQYGNYVPNVHFDDHDNDIAMRNHAFTQAERIYQSAGAIKTFRTPPYPSTHNMGTARMSARAQDGVCNAWGLTHDIPNLFISDGSQFTTGGAENPTLTIVTLAIRQADYIAAQMAQRAL